MLVSLCDCKVSYLFPICLPSCWSIQFLSGFSSKVIYNMALKKSMWLKNLAERYIFFCQFVFYQQVLIKNHFAGLNFIDIAVRSGHMKTVQPGGILGFEGAGTVEKLGSDVQSLSIGDRVAFGFIGSSKYLSVIELIRIISG